MQLVLDSKGLTLKKRNKSFLVIWGKTSRMISPYKVSSILVLGECLMSSSAIKLALLHDIPVVFGSEFGSPIGAIRHSRPGGWTIVRRNQALFGRSVEATRYIIQLFEYKLDGWKSNLLFVSNRFQRLKSDIDAHIYFLDNSFKELDHYKDINLDSCRSNILAIEAKSAKRYWKALSLVLPEEFPFEKRSRQPAKNEFNAAINYMYGILYSQVETYVVSSGMDPTIGFFHKDIFAKPTLVFDLIEPFRPWADSILLELIIGGKLEMDFFVQKNKGIYLDKPGKKIIIPAVNDMLVSNKDFRQKRMTGRGHINRLCIDLAQTLKNWKQE